MLIWLQRAGWWGLVMGCVLALALALTTQWWVVMLERPAVPVPAGAATGAVTGQWPMRVGVRVTGMDGWLAVRVRREPMGFGAMGPSRVVRWQSLPGPGLDPHGQRGEVVGVPGLVLHHQRVMYGQTVSGVYDQYTLWLNLWGIAAWLGFFALLWMRPRGRPRAGGVRCRRCGYDLRGSVGAGGGGGGGVCPECGAAFGGVGGVAG